MPAFLLTSGSPYLNSLIYEAASQRVLHSQADGSAATPRIFLAEHASSEYRDEYVKPYHAAVFVEPRLANGKPSAWTTVSKDDALMRDLLAAYFMHEYHLFPLFQKNYFLEDMAKPKTDNLRTPCCSALLVNAILAYGCVSMNFLRSATSLTLAYSTVLKKYPIALGTGIPKVWAIDSLPRQRGSGRCRSSVVNTVVLRQFKRH